MDKNNNITETMEVSDISVNHLGFSVEDVKAAKAVLTVSSTYLSETPADIEVSLHGRHYEG